MSLLRALARAEQQRLRRRPLDHVLHTLLAAIQHATDQNGAWLAEVTPDDDGRPTLRMRASTGRLVAAAFPVEHPCVQQALFGAAATLAPGALPCWPDDQPGVLLPFGADGETQALLALTGPRPFDATQTTTADVQAVGAVLAGWIEAQRNAHAERRAWRRMEAQLARYRAAMHDALDAVLLVDDEGRVVEANRQADRLLPDSASWFGQPLTEHLALVDLPPLGRHTFTLRADDHPVDGAVYPIPSADGPLRVVVLRDTAEQRRAADALRDLNDELQQRVDELGRLNRENELLGELGAFLQACRAPAEVHAVVQRFAVELFGGSGALYGMENGELLRQASWGGAELSPHLDSGACWALRRGELHTCDAPRGLSCDHSNPHEGTTVCVPVMTSGGPVALLHLRVPPATTCTDRRERLMRAVADRLGASLTTLALQARLRQESIRDPLTRLYNRRYMVETMERELARTRRAGQPLSVVMIDVDHFKRLNDTHGHDMGDRVLQEVARRLTETVRAEDVVCRYGGEEFVTILPGATEELARVRAEAFRAQLTTVGLTAQGSTLPPVTISAGVAMARDRISPDRLLRLADEALLSAKRTGRDRVVVAPSPVPSAPVAAPARTVEPTLRLASD